MGEATVSEERTFLSEAGVLVTNVRIVIQGRTYVTRHINSVQVAKIPPKRILTLALIFAGILASFCLYFGAVMITPTESLLERIERQTVDPLVMAFCCILPGFIVAAGLVALLLQQNRYTVRIAMSSGEVDALRSRNEPHLRRIVEAINQAITEQ